MLTEVGEQVRAMRKYRRSPYFLEEGVWSCKVPSTSDPLKLPGGLCTFTLPHFHEKLMATEFNSLQGWALLLVKSLARRLSYLEILPQANTQLKGLHISDKNTTGTICPIFLSTVVCCLVCEYHCFILLLEIREEENKKQKKNRSLATIGLKWRWENGKRRSSNPSEHSMHVATFAQEVLRALANFSWWTLHQALGWIVSVKRDGESRGKCKSNIYDQNTVRLSSCQMRGWICF